MSRITKVLAEEISNKLVEKLDVQIKSADKKLAKILYSEATKKVPVEVMTAFSLYPQWISKTTSGYIHYGAQQCYIKGDKEFPYLGSLKTTDIDTCVEIDNLLNERDTLKAKRNNLFDELSATIFNLSTYAKVREFFPEAAHLLPELKMEIAINIKDTRDKLNAI